MISKATSTTAPHASQIAATETISRIPAILAVLIGLFLVWGVGLANPATLHNAAHDSRHALGFPCH
jgi:cobalt transporter subunit CbtB